MKDTFRRNIISVAVALGMLPGCGGAVGEKLRPTDHTASGAVTNANAKTCSGAPKYAKPLVVDLEADTRVDLEAAMKRGVVVVNYDCATIRVLPTCKLPEGVYEYAGTTRREQVVQIKNKDELGANLPLSQGKLSAELVSGRTIDLALVYVGQMATTANKISKDQLSGGCDEATHYVQMATLGAFSMQTGSIGKVGAVADLFGKGAKGASSSEHKAMTSDGSLDDCRTSKADASDPPGECRSPLRVELVPLVGLDKEEASDPKKGGKKGDKKDDNKDEDKKEARAVENPCPAGFAMTDGICTKDANAAFVCEAKNEAQCKEQCGKGSAESCYNLGVILTKKTGHRAESVPHFRKACSGDVAEACASLGIELIPDTDDPDVAAKAKESLGFLKKACDGGAGRGCDFAGDVLTDKDYKVLDIAAGVRAYDRGCDLGTGMACWSLAELYFEGKLVPKDGKKGLALLTKSCIGGSADECYDMSKLLWKGKDDVKADPETAIRAARRACAIDVDYCSMAAEDAENSSHFDVAFALAKRGCDKNEFIACNVLAKMYESGHGVTADPEKAKEFHKKACLDGEGEETSCKKVGIKMKD